MMDDKRNPIGQPLRPRINIVFDARDFDGATIDAVADELNKYADASAVPVYKFSEVSVALSIALELLMSTLTGIGANALYDALKPVRQPGKRLSLRLRLYPDETGRERRVLDCSIDVDDSKTFERAMGSINKLLDRQGEYFSYNAQGDQWEDLTKLKVDDFPEIG
ncbi:MAG: hypothetical protein ACJ789_05525 [Thermomicrobiales bacterium]